MPYSKKENDDKTGFLGYIGNSWVGKTVAAGALACSIYMTFPENKLEDVKESELIKNIKDTEIYSEMLNKVDTVNDKFYRTKNKASTVFDRYVEEYIEDSTVAARNLFRESGKTAYLTFDDGPSENTEEILETLDEYGVDASFFVNWRGEGKEDIYKDIVDDGHLIGNHNYSHRYKDIYSSAETYVKKHLKLEKIIQEETGVKTEFYRFPGGSDNRIASEKTVKTIADILGERNNQFIDWNVTSGDASGKDISSEQIVDNVVERSEKLDDAVILLHDSRHKDKTVDALPEIIEKLRKRGYRFDTVDQAPEMKNIEQD